jgi:hypothetical protein
MSQTEIKDGDSHDEAPKTESTTNSSSPSCEESEKSPTEESANKKEDKDKDDEGSKAETPMNDSSPSKESKEPPTEKAPILTEKVETKNMNNQDQKRDLKVGHGDRNAPEVLPTDGTLIASDAANTSPIKEVNTEGVQKATDAKIKVLPASKEDKALIELGRKENYVSRMIARLRENSKKGQHWDCTVLPCPPTSELWIAELTCQNFYKVSSIKSEGKKMAKNEMEKAKEEVEMKERRIFRACSYATTSDLDAYRKVIAFLETELEFDDKLQKLRGMHYSLLSLRIECANNYFSPGQAKVCYMGMEGRLREEHR